MKRYGTLEIRRAVVMLAVGVAMSAAALLWSGPAPVAAGVPAPTPPVASVPAAR
jgi:hypothetical protein